ncbi:hypothetical protein J6590_076549 [Homalodisca vitripennis]|nr:hypothetical protein J6590_076549 [Homalodisca vitripennis]
MELHHQALYIHLGKGFESSAQNSISNSVSRLVNWYGGHSAENGEENQDTGPRAIIITLVSRLDIDKSLMKMTRGATSRQKIWATAVKTLYKRVTNFIYQRYHCSRSPGPRVRREKLNPCLDL